MRMGLHGMLPSGPVTRVISARMTPGRLTAHPCRRVTGKGEPACHRPWLADGPDAPGSPMAGYSGARAVFGGE